jgi:DNA-binding PadR family transcriptional regulator
MTPPVFAHGHLRLYLLSLLAERPMHGYELIQALSDRFGGTYVPSAGTIYPRLAKLEEDALVSKESDGRKTVYSITDAGRLELSTREGELGGIEDELSDSVRRLANEVRTSVNDAMKTLRADLAAAARDARVETRTEARRERTESTGASRSTSAEDARIEARLALRDAEAALNDFRQQLRADLRTEASAGRLEASTVSLLTTRLTELRREITVALRG